MSNLIKSESRGGILENLNFGNWDPFQNFNTLLNELSNIQSRGQSHALIDIYEDDSNIYAQLELPGMKKENINIFVEENTLTVEAQEVFDQKEKGFKQHKERSFSNSILLPDHVDKDRVSAELKDGILHLTLPRMESKKPRRIEIK